jgi:hypothetical protein
LKRKSSDAQCTHPTTDTISSFDALQSEKVFIESDDWRTAPVRIDMLKALARKWKLNARADFWREVAGSRLKLARSLMEHLVTKAAEEKKLAGKAAASAAAAAAAGGASGAATGGAGAAPSAKDAASGTGSSAGSGGGSAGAAGAEETVNVKAVRALRKALPRYTGAQRSRSGGKGALHAKPRESTTAS